ncbi:microtubule-associated tumor suppressor 1 homolog A [Scomber scombrus]|uniref:Microtubule-associated tumor suppressor 1 homolog A n=1 Tax=Scomber scombrus TaxID=13677 RepID=A0AAV1PU96_SCOSC
MSSKTFNMSTENHIETAVPLLHRGLQLGLSPESQYSDSSLSPSPDSPSSISILSEREASSSPDVNMLEFCLSEASPVDNPQDTALLQDSLLCGVSMNLNQTFIATPVNDSMNFWNENLSLRSSQEPKSEQYQPFSKNAECGSSSVVTSPDCAGRDSRLSSRETSRRGSVENDCCSITSGRMVMRTNSFCLADQSLVVFSSLEESISPAAVHPVLPAESDLVSPTLPDVCEKSTERVIKANLGHPCLGMTFTEAENWELPPEENDMETSNFLVVLPSEKEGCTFICEASPTDAEKDLQFASTLSALQDIGRDVNTSTPIQNIGNKIPSLRSLSESPFTGNEGSSGLHSAKQQQISASPTKRQVAGLLPSASGGNKMEIKKFPKTDFSNVKSKIVTRNVHQMASQYKTPQGNQSSKHTEVHRGASVRISPTKVRSSSTVASANSKMLNDAQRRMNTGAAHLCETMKQSSGHTSGDELNNRRGSTTDHPSLANTHASAVECSNASSETEQAASSQPAQHAGNETVCFSSLEKSPDGGGQTDPRPTPKKGVSKKIEVKSGSALGQDKPPGFKTQPRRSSESLLSSSRSPKLQRLTQRLSTSFTNPKDDIHLGRTKPGSLTCSPQNKQARHAKATKGPAEHFNRGVKRISLVVESSKATAPGASCDESKSRFRIQPSPRQTRGTPLSQPTAASPRSTRQRQATLGRDECRISRAVGIPQAKHKSAAGSQKAQATGEPSLGTGTASTASIKPQLNGFRRLQTPTRVSFMGHPPTSASRLTRKTLGPSRSLTGASEQSEGAVRTPVSGGTAHKQTPFKTTLLKAKFITALGKNTGPTSLPTACKPAASTSKGPSNVTVSPLRRTASARLARVTSSGPVDKNKPKANSCQQQHQQQASQPNQSNGPPDVVPAGGAESKRKDQSIQKLRGLLAASNCRFEAFIVVLQHALAERDEATRQCRELSQELVNLRGELVCSVHSSELLEKEKEELRLALEDALLKLQAQHQKDLNELEQRLQAFYQAEWDKVHLTYQDEADKCKSLMQQQMSELKANHEALKLELENSHTEHLHCVKQQYENSLEELRKTHNQELQSLDKTLKDAEAALSGQIQELTEENNALIEKLTAEEKRRRQLAEKCQKDSHTLYLEQELDSLKVVLDIKNKQLHQQEKKMMEIDKLTEKNVKLDEHLKKVQQENEDLKARMERHAALSRQLSTEQAVLQESLHKESKVNKRLSMENEELMWKLHNGDLSSPHKVSPTSTSPSHSFSFQSPRSSGVFSSPPVSPR